MSHRRARHLNFGTAGARVHLDPRRLAGSDGDAIATWSDVSGNANHATAAVGNRPLLKLGANGKGGSAVLSFDATNDQTKGPFAYTITAFTGILVANLYGSGSSNCRYLSLTQTGVDDYAVSGHYIPLLRNSGASQFASYANGAFRIANSASGWLICTALHSGSSATNYANGVQGSSYSHTLSVTMDNFMTGTSNLSGEVIGTSLGTLALWTNSLSEPLRRRIEQSLALSYKISWK